MGFEIAKSIVQGENTASLRRWFEVEPSGIPGFEMLISHLSKKALQKIVDLCSRMQYDPKLKTKVNTIDRAALFENYANHVVHDWKGLTVGDLQKMVAINIPEGTDPNEVVPYSRENLIALIDNAIQIDNWIAEIATDPSRFVGRTKSETESEREN